MILEAHGWAKDALQLNLGGTLQALAEDHSIKCAVRLSAQTKTLSLCLSVACRPL